MVAAKNDLVHVLHGASDGKFPLAGVSVGSVKTSLRAAFNIPYFAEARVDGKRVKVDHVLVGGDRLEFIQVFGYKGAKDEPRAKSGARGLLTHYPELVKIVKDVMSRDLDPDKKTNLMAAKVARWCKDHFGPIVNDVATMNEVISKLTKNRDRIARVTHGGQPKKPGRKNTTRKLADFAEAHHSEKTWKEIAEAWNKKHPKSKKTSIQVRDAWRRAYGDKAAPSNSSKKNRANH